MKDDNFVTVTLKPNFHLEDGGDTQFNVEIPAYMRMGSKLTEVTLRVTLNANSEEDARRIAAAVLAELQQGTDE